MRSVRIAMAVAAAAFAVLVASGVWLAVGYRPGPEQVVATVHRIAGLVALLALVGAVVAAIADRAGPSSIGGAIAAVVFTLAASFTGYLLPWDQLALWAVAPGADYAGVLKAGFSDEIRFILIDGTEIGQDTYARWVVVHLAALPLAGAIAAAVAIRRRTG